MACGREERSDCCDSKTKYDQYGECIDESFEYTRNEEENDRTRDAGTEYGGANVDNANQWIVHWNPVKSKLNEMRPDPPCVHCPYVHVRRPMFKIAREMDRKIGTSYNAIPFLIPTPMSGIMHMLSLKRSDTLISYITLHALIS
ncbi:hypothetical protein CAPTEDRAFT_186549 [Capitella teleta]|uniref:Uncharacterized protein n=1 Tax=Capitella teleta TaxID=283909 RepID=R7U0S2_CAPTE|nr:hypothetical protein CAPTEDRAFT_186549 [Capitella teleta]|eukprot:ELT99604.1 hypothetical protein CAPTEDRAFT_186549 [Capitella teleta]